MSDIEVNLNFGAVDRVVREAAADSLTAALEVVGEESDRHVPVDSGRLRESRRIVVDRTGLEGAVTYDTLYAPVVHESMTEHHEAGQTAKFLEHAGNAEATAVAAEVASQIRRALGI